MYLCTPTNAHTQVEIKVINTWCATLDPAVCIGGVSSAAAAVNANMQVPVCGFRTHVRTHVRLQIRTYVWGT